MEIKDTVIKYKLLLSESTKKKLLLDEEGVKYMKSILESGERDAFASFLCDVLKNNITKNLGLEENSPSYNAVSEAIEENKLKILKDFSQSGVDDDTLKSLVNAIYDSIREQNLPNLMRDSITDVFGVRQGSKMGKVIDNMVSRKFIIEPKKSELYKFIYSEMKDFMNEVDINKIVSLFKRNIN